MLPRDCAAPTSAPTDHPVIDVAGTIRSVPELATWRARAADSDSAAAAEVWTDPSAPAEVLRRPPAAVLDYLLGDGCRHGVLPAVLRNPALPNTVVAALATRAKGEARATIARHALRDRENLPRLIASAAAITPAELAKAIDGLRYGWEHHHNPDAAHATLAKILRAFTTSPQTRCRALAAQAFPLTLGPRHRYADGEVSASRLVADSEVAVLVALARNYHMRNLPETGEGLAVRRALLSSDQPRVRAAARRAGVHVLDSHVSAALSAAHGHPITPDPETTTGAEQTDPLDDPAPAVRVTAVVNGINRQDGTRWARVLADPSTQVRKAAATHGYCTPQFVWTALATDPDPAVRKAVAASRWTPAELQRRLLSDTDPQVSTAANTRDPLSRAIRVRPSLPADGSLMLPVSYSHDPRIRLLDITAATLTLDQQQRLAETARLSRPERAEARDRVIHRLGASKAARWVVDRWERWCQVFAVPAPVHALSWVDNQLAAPFRDLDGADDRAMGALALFDAVLGLAAAPERNGVNTDQDSVDQDAEAVLLTGPWEHVCLPTPVTEDTVYGPRTPAAREFLTTAARLPRARMDALLTTRIDIDDQQWKTARNEAKEAVTGPAGHLYAAHFLFWDTVAVAELATWERPTDPLLADALWGATTVALHAEELSAATIATLIQPCTTAGLTLPS